MSRSEIHLATVRNSFVSLGLALAVTGGALAYEPPSTTALKAAESSFLLRPGVVVEPAGQTLYVMQDEGVAAYSATGEQLWQSSDAARPLGLYGDQLVAAAEPQQMGRADIVLLDAVNGDLLTTVSVPLPSGVGGWVVERPARRFDATVHVIDRQLLLSWTFYSRPLRGAAVVAEGRPTPGLTEQKGSVRLDPATGRALPVKFSPVQVFRFAVEEEARLPNLEGRQFRAGDGRVFLASRKLESPDGWNYFRWTIADGAGHVLGSVERPVSTAPFFVAGTRLIHEEGPAARRLANGEFETHGLRLIAMSLDGDEPLWSIDLRDPVYRGIQPP